MKDFISFLCVVLLVPALVGEHNPNAVINAQGYTLFQLQAIMYVLLTFVNRLWVFFFVPKRDLEKELSELDMRVLRLSNREATLTKAVNELSDYLLRLVNHLHKK